MPRPITKCGQVGCLSLGEYVVVFHVPLSQILRPWRKDFFAPFTVVVTDGRCSEHRSPKPRDYFTDDDFAKWNADAKERGLILCWADMSVSFHPMTLAARLREQMKIHELKGDGNGEQ